MIKAATISLGLLLFSAGTPLCFAQTPAEQTAVSEVLRRDAARIELRQTLADAEGLEARNDLVGASKLYDHAWELVLQVGPGVEAEARQVQAGLANVRMQLAEAAQRRSDYREADKNVRDVLRVDPNNPIALDFKAANDKMLAEVMFKLPSPEIDARARLLAGERATNNIRVQDGRVLFEMGRWDEAETTLKLALKDDPENQQAYYYLNLIKDARFKAALRTRETSARNSMVEIEQEWATTPKRDTLPWPNPYARSTLPNTGRGRQIIYSKLDRIRLDNIKYEGLPLSEVMVNLSEEAKKRDPDHKGINFIINPNVDVGAAPAVPGVDPTTGLPVTAAAPPEPIDMGAIQIRLSLTDIRLADALDAIVKVADRRIKYSIEDYAVVFSLKGAEPSPLYTRIIKVDPNTFLQGLESVVGFPFGNITTSSGGGGGGGGGGAAGGQAGQGALAVPLVQMAGGTAGGIGGAGGGVGGGGGQTGNGVGSVTRTNEMVSVQTLVRNFFITMGVDLTAPKSIFFNDREGSLFVHATLTDLDTIETAVQVLNISPPQVDIRAKFVEVSQTDNRALGFDWYLGNFLMNNHAIGVQGGTAPSFAGAPSTANPEGTFPGSVAGGTTLAPALSDQLLTSGLRNTLNAPAVATFSGILTDPQFRVVMRALEQREGADLLSESHVTTLSGRQTQIQVVDLITIVTGTSLNQTTTGGGGGLTGAAGAGAVGSTVNYPTQILPFGPTLDVVPYVSADGYTIQMTIIPTITEFLGYDDPGQFVPQAQSVSGGAGGAAIPLRAQLPLPHFRLRQVTTSANVWDGQTVVLGGLITDNITKLKDKVPVLGDLPLVGRLFRSESSSSTKKNLVIFVTPTIIDPSGAPYHSDDEMPFAQTAIPRQPAPAP